ncbi:cytochrome P450 [Streptomyces sp. NBRC 110611]|uniref:cytochrome P450 n=1 Tax=Streptomyces sp. NBRC 110611 TaxID=1621259 RepID=UPI0008574C28|nr:cytochrome P450 [Streptomyces sp. NBRC 110611]GAU70356.1 cytochrome P450 [Streptomyces sp. NBRC 110611]
MTPTAKPRQLPEPDLEHIDLFDPEFHATDAPHAVWAAMRARAPLHRQVLPDGRAFWSVTRYADACRVLGDHRSFTSERGSLLPQLGQGDVSAGKMLVSTDPPRHGRLRRPLVAPLSVRAVEAWEARVREAVVAFLSPGPDGGVWDVAQRALRLPMAVAGALLGLPERDWDDLVRWTAMAAAPADPAFRTGGQGATLAVAHHQLFAYFSRRLREQRRDDLAEGLLPHLLTAAPDGVPLTEEEALYTCYSLLLGANATTPHTVAGTLLALSAHPDQFARVDADRALIPSLVEEGLRWTSPASSFLRYATADTELSGGRVRAGDAVAVWIGSANRDESVFADPHTFDVGREDNRHIAFGYGPHYCLGAGLARLTFRVLFDEFFRRFAAVEVAGPVRRLRSVFVSGMTRLPVRTPARPART